MTLKNILKTYITSSQSGYCHSEKKKRNNLDSQFVRF